MNVFPTKILLATDGSEDAHLAARSAVNLSERTGSELHVVHVGEHTISPYYTEIIEEVEREASELLDREVKQIEDYGGEVTEAHVRLSHPDEKIVTLAQEIGAGLVVVGSRGLSPVRRLLVGSVSEFVVRHAHCPVLVVRWRPVSFPIKVLLATDGSEEAQLATRSAIVLGQLDGSELHVIYVVHRGEELRQPEGLGFGSVVSQEELKRMGEEMLARLVKQIEDAGGSVAQAHLRQGRADEKIVAQAEEIGAGLIVVGSRGLGGVRRALMGSVSDSVVRHAHCPVMVARTEKEHSTGDEPGLLA